MAILAAAAFAHVPPVDVSDNVSGATTSSARIAPAGHSHGVYFTAWAVNDAYAWSLAAWVPALERSAASAGSIPSRARRRRGGSPDVEACIARNENGGDYGRSSNPSHFGKYQYDRQTWAANGGDPATWGSASPEEQERVFRSTVDRYGYAPWRGDGCV